MAKEEAVKLKNNLKIKKIARKQRGNNDDDNNNNNGTSIRIRTSQNYTKWRIETEVETLPGIK